MNLDERAVPGYGFDREMQLKSVDFLRKLRADRNCRAVLYSHSEPKERQIVI